MSRPRRPRSRALAAALALATLPLAGCSGDDGGEDRTITVLAAASLTGTFTDLAAQFEADHPGVSVRLAFDSSATLAQQALEGAPADVLATADEETMTDAGDAVAEGPEVFATNEMVLTVPADNPADVGALADLDSPGVTWVACVETAPCGRVAAALIAAGGLSSAPASLEVDVKAVLTKVVADEADAGLVYATDAVAAGDDVQSFPAAGSQDERTAYPVSVLDQADDAALAGEFVDLVLSSEGRGVLGAAGFGAP